MKNKYIIFGASGHGKVIADILELNKEEIYCFADKDIEKINQSIYGYKCLSENQVFEMEDICDYLFLVAIGDNRIRQKVVLELEKHNVKFGKAIHPSAQTAKGAEIGEGTVVIANTAINSDSIIGKHCIINTSSSVDHDNNLGDYVHISPGVHLGGGVDVGSFSWIGLGASVKNNIKIGTNVLVGAGSVVVNDLESDKVYIGNPAKFLRNNN